MNCLEFRRRVGGEPSTGEPDVVAHRAGCPTCARHQDELQAMDRLLGRAMRVELGDRRRTTGDDTRPAAPAGRRWFAMAASLVAGVLVAATLWVSWPAPTLAAEVIDHALHEPDAWHTTGAMRAAEVAQVLGAGGARLREGAGPVTYARRCFFDGHWVPHLVLRTGDGPVTVFLLGHREVASAVRIEERGFSAVVLPAPHGSIAVVGQGAADLDTIARQVFNAVEWGD